MPRWLLWRLAVTEYGGKKARRLNAFTCLTRAVIEPEGSACYFYCSRMELRHENAAEKRGHLLDIIDMMTSFIGKVWLQPRFLTLYHE